MSEGRKLPQALRRWAAAVRICPSAWITPGWVRSARRIASGQRDGPVLCRAAERRQVRHQHEQGHAGHAIPGSGSNPEDSRWRIPTYRFAAAAAVAAGAGEGKRCRDPDRPRGASDHCCWGAAPATVGFLVSGVYIRGILGVGGRRPTPGNGGLYTEMWKLPASSRGQIRPIQRSPGCRPCPERCP